MVIAVMTQLFGKLGYSLARVYFSISRAIAFFIAPQETLKSTHLMKSRGFSSSAFSALTEEEAINISTAQTALIIFL